MGLSRVNFASPNKNSPIAFLWPGTVWWGQESEGAQATIELEYNSASLGVI